MAQWHRDITAQRVTLLFAELEDSAVLRRPVGAEAGVAGTVAGGRGRGLPDQAEERRENREDHCKPTRQAGWPASSAFLLAGEPTNPGPAARTGALNVSM